MHRQQLLVVLGSALLLLCVLMFTHVPSALARSEGVQCLPPVPLSTSLPAPTGLKAKAGNAQVSLTWNAVKGATGYWIYDQNTTTGSGWSRLPFPVTIRGSTVEPLTNGNRYCFRVTAFNASEQSGPSNIACATPS